MTTPIPRNSASSALTAASTSTSSSSSDGGATLGTVANPNSPSAGTNTASGADYSGKGASQSLGNTFASRMSQLASQQPMTPSTASTTGSTDTTGTTGTTGSDAGADTLEQQYLTEMQQYNSQSGSDNNFWDDSGS